MNNEEFVGLVRNKRYIELDQSQRDIIDYLAKELSLNQKNILYLAFMFDETIETAVKKAINFKG